MALPIPDGNANDFVRMGREIEKIQQLAVAGGRRPPTSGSVIRKAVRKSGAKVRIKARRLTPSGKRKSKGKKLRSALKGLAYTAKRRPIAGYRVGYGRSEDLRFQKSLAIQYGTKRVKAQNPIGRAIEETNAGATLVNDIAQNMATEIDKLAAKFNAR